MITIACKLQVPPYTDENIMATLLRTLKGPCRNINRKRGLGLPDGTKMFIPTGQRLTWTILGVAAISPVIPAFHQCSWEQDQAVNV